MPVIDLLILLALGLFAGVLGGLLGVGGSIVIIPVLTLVMRADQHVSQAAAMIINVFVAAAALVQHHRAGAVRWRLVARMLPFGLVFIVVGVEVSNLMEGKSLQKLYGLFLLYVIVFNLAKLWQERHPVLNQPAAQLGWARLGVIGSAMGFVAGLMGIGGGPVVNPLLQRLCHLPLRQTIATGTAVMCVTALVGAARKNMTLSDLTDAAGESLGLQAQESLLFAVALAPTAIVGALFGAALTHVLPVHWVRVAFILLMAWASAKMLNLV